MRSLRFESMREALRQCDLTHRLGQPTCTIEAHTDWITRRGDHCPSGCAVNILWRLKLRRMRTKAEENRATLRIILAAKADAWDEGWRANDFDYTSNATNPYRYPAPMPGHQTTTGAPWITSSSTTWQAKP